MPKVGKNRKSEGSEVMTNYKEPMIQSWRTNSAGWTNAVRERQIESRGLVTDTAILTDVFRLQPKSLLDVGCIEPLQREKLR